MWYFVKIHSVVSFFFRLDWEATCCICYSGVTLICFVVTGYLSIASSWGSWPATCEYSYPYSTGPQEISNLHQVLSPDSTWRFPRPTRPNGFVLSVRELASFSYQSSIYWNFLFVAPITSSASLWQSCGALRQTFSPFYLSPRALRLLGLRIGHLCQKLCQSSNLIYQGYNRFAY